MDQIGEVILKLLDILPHWYILIAVTVVGIHMICKNQIRSLSKLLVITKNIRKYQLDIIEIKKDVKELNEKLIDIMENDKKQKRRIVELYEKKGSYEEDKR